jgi:DNA primase small subunit
VEAVKRGVWPIPTSRNVKDFFEPIQRLVKGLSPYMGKEIDTNTSVDIHRLIRVPDSIHGGTGLLAKRLNDIWHFDPFKDAVALSDRPELEVFVSIAPEFEFAGETWGPYRNQKVLLPLHVSIYLMSRGVATWTLASED